MFLCFLVLDVVAPCPVAIKGVHWAKDGPKFACNIDGCNASYLVEYNLVWHLLVCHNVTMEMPIYLKARPKGSRSCINECVGLEKPFDLVSSQ
jgi:hypothetical protein